MAGAEHRDTGNRQRQAIGRAGHRQPRRDIVERVAAHGDVGRVVVVGTGIAGLIAAHRASKHHDVVLVTKSLDGRASVLVAEAAGPGPHLLPAGLGCIITSSDLVTMRATVIKRC